MSGRGRTGGRWRHPRQALPTLAQGPDALLNERIRGAAQVKGSVRVLEAYCAEGIGVARRHPVEEVASYETRTSRIQGVLYRPTLT